jgi:MYXO-CTERM domain-containing protein
VDAPFVAGLDSATIRRFAPDGADLGDFATGLNGPAFIAFAPTTAVPEPATFASAGFAGLIGVGLAWRRRKRSA